MNGKAEKPGISVILSVRSKVFRKARPAPRLLAASVSGSRPANGQGLEVSCCGYVLPVRLPVPEVVCGCCQDVIQVYPGAVGARKYCSTNCAGFARLGRRSCAWCGTWLYRMPARQKYCSRTCAARARQK